MKVKELIKQLQEMPQEAEACFADFNPIVRVVEIVEPFYKACTEFDQFVVLTDMEDEE